MWENWASEIYFFQRKKSTVGPFFSGKMLNQAFSQEKWIVWGWVYVVVNNGSLHILSICYADHWRQDALMPQRSSSQCCSVPCNKRTLAKLRLCQCLGSLKNPKVNIHILKILISLTEEWKMHQVWLICLSVIFLFSIISQIFIFNKNP